MGVCRTCVTANPDCALLPTPYRLFYPRGYSSNRQTQLNYDLTAVTQLHSQFSAETFVMLAFTAVCEPQAEASTLLQINHATPMTVTVTNHTQFIRTTQLA